MPFFDDTITGCLAKLIQLQPLQDYDNYLGLELKLLMELGVKEQPDPDD